MTLQANFYSWINKRCIFFYGFFPFGRICAYTSVVGVWLLFCSTSCVWVPEGSDLSRHRLCENFLCCLPGCKQGHQTSNELKAICPMLLMSSPASEYCPSYSSSTLSMKLTSVSQDGFLSMLVQNRALTSMGLLAQMQLAAGSVLLTGRSIEPHQKDLPRAAGSAQGASCLVHQKMLGVRACVFQVQIPIQIQQTSGGGMGHIKSEMSMNLSVNTKLFPVSE